MAYGSAVETAELLELSTELNLLPNDLTGSTLERVVPVPTIVTRIH